LPPTIFGVVRCRSDTPSICFWMEGRGEEVVMWGKVAIGQGCTKGQTVAISARPTQSVPFMHDR